MNEIIDLIATDSSAADISDKIKDTLYAKAAEKIESQRSDVAVSMFDPSIEDEVTTELETSEDE
mgnify:FL=1|tara:strand:+ start:1216 stop:1407 length:192 start_codon:yes stop_codon:yes gene_type:complete